MLRVIIRRSSSAIPRTLGSFDIFQNTGETTKVNGLSDSKFSVNNVVYSGPIVILDNKIFLWNVPQFGLPASALDISKAESPAESTAQDSSAAVDPVFYGWSTEMLKILEHADPSPEILVFGTGAKSARLPPLIKQYILSLGMQVDVMPTVRLLIY
jgi:uncharacterized protein